MLIKKWATLGLNVYMYRYMCKPSIALTIDFSLCIALYCLAGNWDRLPPRQKQEKEMFLSGEQRASKGFMTQANTQMELLYNMSEAEPVARCLCDPSLAKRTAAAVSHAC